MEYSPVLFEQPVLERFRIPIPLDPEAMIEYQEREKADALSTLHPDFGWTNLWWVLELIPMPVYFRAKGKWFWFPWYAVRRLGSGNFDSLRRRRPHLFQARKIRQPSAKSPTLVHSSVLTRLRYFRDRWGRQYRNAAKWDPELTHFEEAWATPGGNLPDE